MSQENVEIVRNVYEHVERNDWAGAVEFIDSEVEFVRVGTDFADLAGEWRGRAEAGRAILEWYGMWQDLQIAAERFIDLDDDRVMVLERQTGRGKTSGIVVQRETAWLFTLRDGKIVRSVGYWDRAQAAESVGLRE